jgi:hypothetical protein
MGEKRNSYKSLVWKPHGKRPLVTAMHKSDSNMKMDLEETGWEGIHWII